VQPDEFLVTGEALVRNLMLGIRKAEALGGSSLVGYIPDSFGHIAQMVHHPISPSACVIVLALSLIGHMG
jgi:alpha-mannosidase